MYLKSITLFVALLFSTLGFGQSTRDIKALEKQKDKMLKRIDKVEKYISEDRSQVYNCHPDLEAPFSELKDTVAIQAQALRDSVESKFAVLLDDSENGLVTLIESIEARKKEIKKEKNRSRKRTLRKLLRAQKKHVRELADNLASDLQPVLRADLKRLISADGKLNLAMKEYRSEMLVKSVFKEKINSPVGNNMSPAENYNQNLTNLMNMCQTKDCVKLLAAEIKNVLKTTLCLNKSIRVVRGANLKKNKAYLRVLINLKLDKLTETIANRKALKRFDPNCVAQPAAEVKTEEEDEQSSIDVDIPSINGHGGTEITGGEGLG